MKWLAENWFKLAIVILIPVTSIILVYGFIIYPESGKKINLEQQNEESLLKIEAEEKQQLMADELAETKRQNDLNEQLLKNEEAERYRQEEIMSEKQACLQEQLNIINPYYGYNDDGFKLCLKIMSENGTFTYAECKKKYDDRLDELEDKEDRARINCGL